MTLSVKEEKALMLIGRKKPYHKTPCRRIKIGGFSNVWVKDESRNPTGTHKDRLAKSIVSLYEKFLISKKNETINKLPSFSIISSGSAAIAIQSQLKKYGLPRLKVLVDKNIEKGTLRKLEEIGCEIYIKNLSRKFYDKKEILKVTKNNGGLDVVSSQLEDSNSRLYGCLAREILKVSPDYCFMPFGSGNLYESVLITNKRILEGKIKGRFKKDVLKGCNFLGAKTDNQKSCADKLFAMHLPYSLYSNKWISALKKSGFCGRKSGVFTMRESYLRRAVKLSENFGIECEPSGAAGLALFLQMKEMIPEDKKILIVNTGKTKV